MKPETTLASGHDAPTGDCCGAPHAAAVPVPVIPGAAGRTFRIATMDCSAEESDIRRALEPIAGIRSLGFQLGARTLRIDASEEAYARALDAIRKAGFDPQPAQSATAQTQGHEGHDHSHDHSHDGGFGGGATRLVAALVLAIAAEAVSFFAPELLAWKIAGMAIAALAIGLAGLDTYKKGMAALLRGKLNINALMSVAVTGAFLIGQWPEAAMVMALYAIAELIEARAVDRARNAIKGLLDMAPEQALMKDTSGAWSSTPVAAVPLQAIVRIRPGERVPLDGLVTQGSSAINQAPITGERQGNRRCRFCRHHQ
jgi:Cd2+/Zn2+-exporting ATPase